MLPAPKPEIKKTTYILYINIISKISKMAISKMQIWAGYKL